MANNPHVDPLTEQEVLEAFRVTAVDARHDRVGQCFEYVQNFGKDPDRVRRVVLERALHS